MNRRVFLASSIAPVVPLAMRDTPDVLEHLIAVPPIYCRGCYMQQKVTLARIERLTVTECHAPDCPYAYLNGRESELTR